jgi:hypothetical protein
MALTGKAWWYVGGGLALLYLVQKYRIDSTVSDMGSDSGVPLGVEGADAAMANPVTINVKLTTYYPSATGAAATMEGGANDMAGKPLHTLDDYQAGNAEYVSLSADNTVFPYGQRVSLDAWPDVVFRIVDTGGHFSSLYNKVYRIAGYEPVDVASAQPESATAGHPRTAVMTIYPGDDWAGQKPKNPAQALDYSNIQGQTPQEVAEADPSVSEFGDPEAVA